MGPVTPALSVQQRVEALMETVLLDLESAVSSQHQHAVHQSPQIQLTSEIQTTPAPTPPAPLVLAPSPYLRNDLNRKK